MKVSNTLKAFATLYAVLFTIVLLGATLNLILVFVEPSLLKAMSVETFQTYLRIKAYWLFAWQWSARLTVIVLEYAIVAMGIEFAGNVLRRPV